MGYASKSGRARTNSRSPQAHAICDRCGFRHNHVNLKWQYDWRGASLANTRLLVCSSCYDAPQQQLRSIVIPADPMPIQNPRIQDFVTAGSNFRATSGQNTVDPLTGIPIPGNTLRITENDDYRVTQQTGAPNGSLNELPGTDPNAVTYRVISNAADNGSGLIRLTVNTTSGMITNQQVTVADIVGTTEANGNWTITVISLTEVDLIGSAFANTYTSGGYVVNNPALPYNNTTVPPTGPM